MNDAAQPDMLRDPYGSWIQAEGVGKHIDESAVA